MFNYNPRAYPECLKGDVDTSIQTIFTSETSIEEEKQHDNLEVTNVSPIFDNRNHICNHMIKDKSDENHHFESRHSHSNLIENNDSFLKNEKSKQRNSFILNKNSNIDKQKCDCIRKPFNQNNYLSKMLTQKYEILKKPSGLSQVDNKNKSLSFVQNIPSINPELKDKCTEAKNTKNIVNFNNTLIGNKEKLLEEEEVNLYDFIKTHQIVYYVNVIVEEVSEFIIGVDQSIHNRSSCTKTGFSSIRTCNNSSANAFGAESISEFQNMSSLIKEVNAMKKKVKNLEACIEELKEENISKIRIIDEKDARISILENEIGNNVKEIAEEEFSDFKYGRRGDINKASIESCEYIISNLEKQINCSISKGMLSEPKNESSEECKETSRMNSVTSNYEKGAVRICNKEPFKYNPFHSNY